mmetsp:Transcript_16281/g.35394  ORF Transcript_16281/g.35394 Transcript_16281/m.35394 type:complete len:297 (-) Transcript_16281:46-936(-)
MAAAAFPPPPSFYKLYGSQESEEEQSDAKGAVRVLPPDPPTPVEGEYPMFGTIYSTEHGLPPLPTGTEQLYRDSGDDVDLRNEFRKLNKQLLFHFIDLVHNLTKGPRQQIEQVNEVTVILHNMHHLLNAIRPRQARATLKRVLEEQVARKEKALEIVRARRCKAKEVFSEAEKSLRALGLERQLSTILSGDSTSDGAPPSISDTSPETLGATTAPASRTTDAPTDAATPASTSGFNHLQEGSSSGVDSSLSASTRKLQHSISIALELDDDDPDNPLVKKQEAPLDAKPDPMDLDSK